MSANVYIAGIGVISAIGNSAAQCYQSLAQSEAGIGAMVYLDSAHKHELPVAEVKMGNGELAAKAGFKPGITRTASLSMIAAAEALGDAAIPVGQKWRTGFISGNTVGGMDKTEKFFPLFQADAQAGRLRNVINHECGAATELVAGKLGISHFVTTISTACSSAANAIMLGARMIKNNMLDVVVAGGADALTKFTLNGFNTLMILDHEPCKPFDENRRGLNLGEGAGYVVLVSEKVAATLGRDAYCRVSGYCNANDAYHQTASSPDGTGSSLAMTGALQRAALQPAQIDYINLHGTGTPNNDSSESAAIKRLFHPHYPKMSSTKSYTGHTLGACGGIEAAFSALSIRHGAIYPNLRLVTPMQGVPFVPETIFSANQPIKHVLSNSFGFGGNCTSLVFSGA